MATISVGNGGYATPALVGLAMLLSLSGVACAQDYVDHSRKGFELCASRFPETKQTRELLKQQGWDYRGTDGDFHIFTDAKNKAIIATTAAGERRQGCLMTFQGLDETHALALAAKIGKAYGFIPVKSSGLPLGEGWLASLNGVKVILFATSTFNFNLMRTSAIWLRKVD